MAVQPSREFFPTSSPQRLSGPRRLLQDLLLVLSLTLLSGVLSAHFEVSERMLAWLHRREALQMDEWPGVLLVLTCALLWFGQRRYRDLAQALADRHLAEQRLAEQLERNRALHLELLAVQERERQGIARELHDELGQYLSALHFDLHELDVQEADAEERKARHTRAHANLARVQVTLRNVMGRLRPAALDELGLAAALEQLVSGWRQRLPDTRIQFHCEDGQELADAALSIAIFRVVQEALTNVAKHSRAGLVQVSIRRSRQGLAPAPPGTRATRLVPPAAAGEDALTCVEIEVSDDGVGFDPAMARQGLGLLSIHERVEALGGECRCTSAPGDGCTLLIRLPVARHA